MPVMALSDLTLDLDDLMGYRLIERGFTPAQVTEAINWGADFIAKEEGLTYAEAPNVTVSATGMVALPEDLINLVRVFQP